MKAIALIPIIYTFNLYRALIHSKKSRELRFPECSSILARFELALLIYLRNYVNVPLPERDATYQVS